MIGCQTGKKHGKESHAAVRKGPIQGKLRRQKRQSFGKFELTDKACCKKNELPEKEWLNDKENYHVKGNAGLARSQAKNKHLHYKCITPLGWNSFSRTIKDTNVTEGRLMKNI